MDWQLSNALFIAVTTLSTFLVLGLAAKLTLRFIRWSHVGAWMVFGLAVVMFQIVGTATPRLTVEGKIPSAPEGRQQIESTALIPNRPFSDFTRKIDAFDEKQDQRIKENQP